MTEISTAPEVPPSFEVGLSILETDNFRLVYDHPPGWKKEQLERVFLEPLNQKAENALTWFSEKTGHNLQADRQLPAEKGQKPKTVKALKFNDQPEELLPKLLGKTHETSGRFGYKIPSLQLLETEIATNPALKTSIEVFFDHLYPTTAYSLAATYLAATSVLIAIGAAKHLSSPDVFLRDYSIGMLPFSLIRTILAGFSANEARRYLARKKSLFSDIKLTSSKNEAA